MTTSYSEIREDETTLSAPQCRAARTSELFHRAAACENETQRREVLSEVIEMYLHFAHGQARRYHSRGIPVEDLEQVAALALTRVTQRYDVTRGHDFLSYAMPTIRGELRKHFRDHGWMVRPPRRLQELQVRLNVAAAELTNADGHSPKPSEIARHLGVSTEDVIEALGCSGCFVPASLDHPVGGADSSLQLGDLLVDSAGETDWDAAEARVMLGPVVGQLGDRDRQILSMCFVEGLTQREIGDRLGISQMQVSRLRARIFTQLRKRLGEPAHPEAPATIRLREPAGHAQAV